MLVVEKKHFVEFHAKILVCYKLDHDGYYEFPQFSQWLGAKYNWKDDDWMWKHVF